MAVQELSLSAVPEGVGLAGSNPSPPPWAAGVAVLSA